MCRSGFGPGRAASGLNSPPPKTPGSPKSFRNTSAKRKASPKTAQPHTLSGQLPRAANFIPANKKEKRRRQRANKQASPQPHYPPTVHPPPPRKLQVKDQVQLTSWQGGSGRLEEAGRSTAQAAWQPASAQQQIQAGLQDAESPPRGAPAGRPRPLPQADPGIKSNISDPRRSAGPNQGSVFGGRALLSGREGCTLRPPSARPLPVRRLTARLCSWPGWPAPAFPSRRTVGGTAGRERNVGAGRGAGAREPGSRWHGQRLRPSPAGPRGLRRRRLGAGTSLHSGGPSQAGKAPNSFGFPQSPGHIS